MTALQLLPDPRNDRVVKNVIPPLHHRLPTSYVFNSTNTPNWENLLKAFINDGKLQNEDAFSIVHQAEQILSKESNVLSTTDPIIIVGDLHGQLHDLNKILEIGGSPQENKYLFLGDYVDRGFYSVEVILLLFALKICFPTTVLLLRGNHECKIKSNECNFKGECLRKYNNEVYEQMISSFEKLPLACTINSKFFAVHGGLSPKLKSIQDIEKMNRFQEPQGPLRYGDN
jgi:serine/threonine-protein phosphatase 2B catalytic subunit